jgi:outer membrane protein TolC
VRLEIQSAWDVLRAASDSIVAARLNVTQAERVLEMMQSNYRYAPRPHWMSSIPRRR